MDGTVQARTRLLRQVPEHARIRAEARSEDRLACLLAHSHLASGRRVRATCAARLHCPWAAADGAARVGAALAARRAGSRETSATSDTAPAARLGGLSGPSPARSGLRRVECTSCVRLLVGHPPPWVGLARRVAHATGAPRGVGMSSIPSNPLAGVHVSCSQGIRSLTEPPVAPVVPFRRSTSASIVERARHR